MSKGYPKRLRSHPIPGQPQSLSHYIQLVIQSILLKIPEQTGLTIISKHICIILLRTILSTLDIRILGILTILCRTLLRAVLKSEAKRS